MSKTTSLMAACQRSLEELTEAHSWEKRFSSTTGDTATEIVEVAGTGREKLLFRTSINRPLWEGDDPVVVYVEMEIETCFAKPALTVSDFNIIVVDNRAENLFLKMGTFQDHTQLIVNPASVFGGVGSIHKKNYWSIGTPASLVRLFQMFDSVSKTYCKEQVFLLT
jgi:hypothetical protein